MTGPDMQDAEAREIDTRRRRDSAARDERRERERHRDRSRDDERRERERHRDRSRDDERQRRRERERDREREERREKREQRDDDRDRDRDRRRREKDARRARRRDSRSPRRDPSTSTSTSTSATLALHYADTGKFEWHKKREKEKALGMTPEEVARRDAARRREAEAELAKLQQKRAEREVERALREEEAGRARRDADDAAMAGWVAREDAFLLEQSRRRAAIRLREQRAKAIDFLAINLRFASAGRSAASVLRQAEAEAEADDDDDEWAWVDAFEIDEPYKIFENLSLEDMTELEADIAMYRSLERAPTNLAFWDAMAVLCAHHLRGLREPARAHDAQVEDEARRIVEGLSWRRLDELEAKTRAMGAADDFWRLVLRKIEVQKAVVRLNAIHETVLKNRLELFRKRQRAEAARAQAEMADAEESDGEADLDPEWQEEEEEEEEDQVEEYDASMSPPPGGGDLPVVAAADYFAALYAARRRVSAAGYAPPVQDVADTDEANARHWRARIAAETADDDLEDMGDDVDLADGLPASYAWGDKYRPRKPRYYNRVHTGYEWTSYNKGHYDKENPPPKVVMGYRFHVFYPDLIDKSTPPTYERVRTADEDTELLVFRAGPPYEDVAFRIVRKQWDYSHRRGFRSHFDRGVLQLAFKFQRDTYRK
ncbi:hypothetical protein CC85DRAFT_307589 [Cutaneotrichosporon oleaginosum]|uniref:Splicing factor Cactin n=1 Tax=Cutaneotrichosporon oleaginosum TaxID=879819 RepID=A0A0J0XQJ1_9TREE|nr:uncharacterized protein CC85DRAFT_307589 [Cutaneotrichosporon oleaginosum]KLT43358.1 hypothetical protein CC85DRAFT_307589 [Cutaneotrichosporon oleaginosum]